MRILIIGAGNTGRNLAATLCNMNNDVVVVDTRQDPLTELDSRYDLLTIRGNGSSPAVLERAEISRTDLIIAVTSKDEINILACLYAQAAGVEHKAARVSRDGYLEGGRLDLKAMGVDLLVSHKEESAREITNMLRLPGTLEVMDLLDNRVLVIGIRLTEDSPLTGHVLLDFFSQEALNQVRFIASLKDKTLTIPHGDTKLEVDDTLYVAVLPEQAEAFCRWAMPNAPGFSRIIIAGGGDLGMSLVKDLATLKKQVVLVETDEAQAEVASAEFTDVLVLHGDITDQESLNEAGMGPDAAFVAITGDEELNVFSCLMARKAESPLTICRIEKPEYVPIIDGLDLLDHAVNPHLSMINAILHFVRGHNVSAAALLHRLPGELLEVEIQDGGAWNNKTLSQVRMPRGAIVAALQRDDTVQVPTGEQRLLAGDKLVIYCEHRAVHKVENLFRK